MIELNTLVDGGLLCQVLIISHAEEFSDVFVTNNKKHYKNLKSKIPILSPKEFLDVYIV